MVTLSGVQKADVNPQPAQHCLASRPPLLWLQLSIVKSSKLAGPPSQLGFDLGFSLMR